MALRDHKPEESRGTYTLTASYTDAGANGIASLTRTSALFLQPAKVKAVNTDAQVGFARYGNSLSGGDHKSFLLLKGKDMTGIKALTYEYASKDKDGEIELRLDSQAGPVIAKTFYKSTGTWDSIAYVTAELLVPVKDFHDLYFVVVKREKPNDDIINIKSIEFRR